MLCPICKKEIPNNSIFCQYCGNKIIKKTENSQKNTNEILSATIGIIILLLTIICIKVGYKEFLSPTIKSILKPTVNKEEIKKAVFVRMFYLSNTETLNIFCQDTGYIPNNFINLFTNSFENSIKNADNIIEKNGFNKNELNNSSTLNKKMILEYEKDYKIYQNKYGSSHTKKDYCKMYDDNANDMVKTKIAIFRKAKPNLFFD